MPIRVVVGEDSAVVREGIQRMLERQRRHRGRGRLRRRRDAARGDRRAPARRRAHRHPDAADADRRGHPDRGRAARIRSPRSASSSSASTSSRPTPSTLLEGGSARRAYLLKERLRDATELTRAIREVAAGGSVIDPLVVDELVQARTARANSPLRELTESETAILAMIAQGLSNSAIAEQLVVTKRAVERHINAIFLKLDLRDAEDVSRRVKAALVYLADQAD